MINLNNFRTYQLAKVLYKECQKLNLKGEMKDQLQRAALSTCLNLAEGSARRSKNDRIRFFNIALASSKEVYAILDILSLEKLKSTADQISAMSYKLILAQKDAGP